MVYKTIFIYIYFKFLCIKGISALYLLFMIESKIVERLFHINIRFITYIISFVHVHLFTESI